MRGVWYAKRLVGWPNVGALRQFTPSTGVVVNGLKARDAC